MKQRRRGKFSNTYHINPKKSCKKRLLTRRKGRGFRMKNIFLSSTSKKQDEINEFWFYACNPFNKNMPHAPMPCHIMAQWNRQKIEMKEEQSLLRKNRHFWWYFEERVTQDRETSEYSQKHSMYTSRNLPVVRNILWHKGRGNIEMNNWVLSRTREQDIRGKIATNRITLKFRDIQHHITCIYILRH